MPRHPRAFHPGQAFHVVRRGRNREPCFTGPEDRALYLSLLVQFARETANAIHAWVLMPNHVHLLLTAGEDGSPSRLMHRVGLAYGRATNRRYGRTGTLWEERFYSTPVESDRYVLSCSRYIELNPVRAAIVEHPADYRWSSYHDNVNPASGSWLVPHPSLLALGSTPLEAGERYRVMFQDPIDAEMLAALRNRRPPPPGTPGTWIDPRSGGQAAANCSSASRA